MIFYKTRGGIIGKSRNVAAVHRWCLSRHKRARYAEAILDRVVMLDDGDDVHKTTRKREIQKSETEVHKIISAFTQFLNPFDIEPSKNDILFGISSGMPATAKVADSLLSYEDVGEKAADSFIKTRLVDKSTKFHEPIKKQNLAMFKTMAVKKTLTTTQKKSVQVKAERNLLGRLLMLSQEHELNLFTYPLGPIPWVIATADGALVKTNKAELMHHLERLSKSPNTTALDGSVHVIDGNAQFQAMTSLPKNFQELCRNVFNSLPKAETVHIVTDTSSSSSSSSSSNFPLFGEEISLLTQMQKGFTNIS